MKIFLIYKHLVKRAAASGEFLRKAIIPAGLVLLFLTPRISVAGSRPLSPGMDFETQMAISEMLTASKPAEFEQAAQALERLIRGGARNGTLFYDYGTMLLMANHPEEAYRAFLRAERYSGSNPQIRHNMLMALSKKGADITVARLPWYRIPLFWHYRLSGRTRLTVAAAAFLALCIAILLRRLHRPEPYRILLTAALATLILFGSSALTSVYQEAHATIGIAPLPDAVDKVQSPVTEVTK